jgi:hypothetical protein
MKSSFRDNGSVGIVIGWFSQRVRAGPIGLELDDEDKTRAVRHENLPALTFTLAGRLILI